MNHENSHGRLPVREVLAEGWRKTITGLLTVFPWVLAAEIVGNLPIAGSGKGLLNTDLGNLAKPGYLAWLLASAFLQALFYGYAVLKLAKRDTKPTGTPLQSALRAIPALVIAYLIYELLVMIGFGFAIILMVLVALLFGIIPGVVVTVIPLAPTAWISTALAFFVFPVVLERRGPFAALGRSMQLAKSNWVHAALVVSVPAIALLCSTLLQEVMPTINAWHLVTHSLSRISSHPTTAQLQNMLSSMQAQQATNPHPWWDGFTVLVSALVWWYTLAVCYVEFRTLKEAGAVTAQ